MLFNSMVLNIYHFKTFSYNYLDKLIYFSYSYTYVYINDNIVSG